jgi:single-strand DNA-binding protein
MTRRYRKDKGLYLYFTRASWDGWGKGRRGWAAEASWREGRGVGFRDRERHRGGRGVRFVVRFRNMAGRSVNKVILLGHLGKDAETRYTASGVPVSKFTLATNRRFKDSQTGDWKEETDWHNIILWRAENLAPYLTKGKQVYIEGNLRTRSWEDKEDQKKRYSTEIVVDEIILLGSQGGAGREPAHGEEGSESRPRGPAAGPRAERAAPPSAPPADDFGPGITDDDVPF